MKQTLEIRKRSVERTLGSCLEHTSIPESLREAMEYSLLAGGKRIRPVLCLTWARLFGASEEPVLPFASSLELIHTYSLVHDDLPAMDDDATRRGQPSNHVRFGEAQAILAGDGLLTHAFSMMLSVPLQAERVLAAASEVARAAGPAGMVGGQVMDMALTGLGVTEVETLKRMHSMKTGAMLRVSCLSGALLAGAGSAGLEKAKRFGAALGLAFQVADDILDVIGDEQKMGKPVGSDTKHRKLTYPALLGLERSRRLGDSMVQESKEALSGLQSEEADFLTALAKYVMNRTE
jgi:geranylgeranyl diphosphate synthase type II